MKHIKRFFNALIFIIFHQGELRTEAEQEGLCNYGYKDGE